MVATSWARIFVKWCQISLKHPCTSECVRNGWVQVTASGLKNSGFPGHGAVIVGEVDLHVRLKSLHVQGTRNLNNLHGVILPKTKVSLRKYIVTCSPARVQLCSICCSEHPGYSHCVICNPRTQQAVSMSHKQEGGLQKI